MKAASTTTSFLPLFGAEKMYGAVGHCAGTIAGDLFPSERPFVASLIKGAHLTSEYSGASIQKLRYSWGDWIYSEEENFPRVDASLQVIVPEDVADGDY